MIKISKENDEVVIEGDPEDLLLLKYQIDEVLSRQVPCTKTHYDNMINETIVTIKLSPDEGDLVLSQ